MAEGTAFKDYLDAGLVRKLGGRFETAWKEFPRKRFEKLAIDGLDQLEFAARNRHIADALKQTLPESAEQSLPLITAVLPDRLEGSEGVFEKHYWLWPLGTFIQETGPEAPEAALKACGEITQCFTAEFAIRPLLKAEPELVFAQLKKWVQHKSEHLRRLVSEGTRPRLPWASRLSLPRKKVLPLLDSLRDDDSRYVQRSVANHFNDLGKDDPDWLVEHFEGWKMRNGSYSEGRGWIVRHALRNHIKQGHPGALALLGYGKLQLEELSFSATPKKVRLGEALEVRFEALHAGKEKKGAIIDFAIHYQKSDGSLSRKVFKWKTTPLAPGERLVLKKSVKMVHRSVRKLHLGAHRIDVQANGLILAEADFQLVEES